MVAGMHKVYGCQKCGARILIAQNGQRLLLREENSDSSPAPERGQSSILLDKLKNALGVLTCPQCGSLELLEDVCLKS